MPRPRPACALGHGARSRQPRPGGAAPGAAPGRRLARPRGSVRKPRDRERSYGIQGSPARRPARAPVRLRHPQSRFRTRHPAPHRPYGEPRGPKSRGPRAGRRAEVSAAAVGPAVVGCALLAAPWLACRSRAGRPAGLRSGLGRRPGLCCARLRRGPGRRRGAREGAARRLRAGTACGRAGGA